MLRAYRILQKFSIFFLLSILITISFKIFWAVVRSIYELYWENPSSFLFRFFDDSLISQQCQQFKRVLMNFSLSFSLNSFKMKRQTGFLCNENEKYSWRFNFECSLIIIACQLREDNNFFSFLINAIIK